MRILKKWSGVKLVWVVAILIVVIIKMFASGPMRVEKLYTYGIYPPISRFFRFIFGWIPFSLGDIFYLVVLCWLLYLVVKNTRLLFRNGFRLKIFLKKCSEVVLAFVFIYIIFNIFWGLNYNRAGIAHQLALDRKMYDTSDLLKVQDILLEKVNTSKELLINRGLPYPHRNELFKSAVGSYNQASKKYPFLAYVNPSVKMSMYGLAGNYLGFTGYYNPFTGEAQVNTTVPSFLQPYIVTHEIAHQIGYAKENEANFVGYLVMLNSDKILFKYSTYLELYMYTNREVFYFDSTASNNSVSLLSAPVKKDIEEWRKFSLEHKGVLEAGINWVYGKYLNLNQQPKGMRTYNQVVMLLVAYYKKYGEI